jgi:hypothetical protein
MRWVTHVAVMRDMKCVYRVLLDRHDANRPLGRPRNKWELILKQLLKKWDGQTWTKLLWLRIGTVVEC